MADARRWRLTPQMGYATCPPCAARWPNSALRKVYADKHYPADHHLECSQLLPTGQRCGRWNAAKLASEADALVGQLLRAQWADDDVSGVLAKLQALAPKGTE